MNSITISGVFREPDGSIVAGVKIEFTQQANSAASFTQRTSEIITADDGSYSIDIFPGRYSVSVTSAGKPKILLGLINISADSQSGTLNDFLITSAPVTNPVIEQMQQLYFAMLAMSKSPAAVVSSAADIPDDAAGFVFVTDDEQKGAPALYLYAAGRRFWLAMVEDSN